jgi:hypothetical protein
MKEAKMTSFIYPHQLIFGMGNEPMIFIALVIELIADCKGATAFEAPGISIANAAIRPNTVVSVPITVLNNPIITIGIILSLQIV